MSKHPLDVEAEARGDETRTITVKRMRRLQELAFRGMVAEAADDIRGKQVEPLREVISANAVDADGNEVRIQVGPEWHPSGRLVADACAALDALGRPSHPDDVRTAIEKATGRKYRGESVREALAWMRKCGVCGYDHGYMPPEG